MSQDRVRESEKYIKIKMETKGGEYGWEGVEAFEGCGLGPMNSYVGPMHKHPNGTLMAGAEHSDKKHPTLKPIDKKSILKEIAKNV